MIFISSANSILDPGTLVARNAKTISGVAKSLDVSIMGLQQFPYAAFARVKHRKDYGRLVAAGAIVTDAAFRVCRTWWKETA